MGTRPNPFAPWYVFVIHDHMRDTINVPNRSSLETDDFKMSANYFNIIILYNYIIKPKIGNI